MEITHNIMEKGRGDLIYRGEVIDALLMAFSTWDNEAYPHHLNPHEIQAILNVLDLQAETVDDINITIVD